MGHSRWDTNAGGTRGGNDHCQRHQEYERSERLELLVNESQGPRSMFGKGGQRPTARILSAR